MSKPAFEPDHIPPSEIWAYKADPSALTLKQLDHLSDCERCIVLLGMCRVSKSLQHFHQLLQEHGFSLD